MVCSSITWDGPYFLKMIREVSVTVIANRYVEMLQSFVTPELNNFPQDQDLVSTG